MDREQVKLIVRVTLLTLTRITRRTRTQADDLMANILCSNEERIVDAVLALVKHPDQPPTDDQVVQALKSVGIQV